MNVEPKTPDYKPRWQIQRDEKRDNKWREAGTYQFICDHCREKATVRLREIKGYRTGANCPKCKTRNEF